MPSFSDEAGGLLRFLSSRVLSWSAPSTANSTSAPDSQALARQDRFERAQTLRAALRRLLDDAAVPETRGDPGTADSDPGAAIAAEAVVRALDACLSHGLRREVKVTRRSEDGRLALLRESNLGAWHALHHLSSVGKLSDTLLSAIAEIETLNVEEVHDSEDEVFFRRLAAERKSRALLRKTMNEGLVNELLESFMGAEKLLAAYFESWALVRDKETAEVVRTLAAGLGAVQVNLPLLPQDRLRRESDLEAALPPPVGAAKSLRERADTARRIHKEALESLNSRTTPFGSPLEDLVRAPSHCALAFQNSSLGVPDVVLRATALLWNHDKRMQGLLDCTVATEKGVLNFRQDSNVVKVHSSLATLGGTGLTVFSRVGVDMTLESALSSIASTTCLGLRESTDDLDEESLARLIVLFLYCLPRPLIPKSMHDAMLLSSSLEDEEARNRNIGLLFETLPSCYKPMVDLTVSFLARVVEGHSVRDKDRVLTTFSVLLFRTKHAPSEATNKTSPNSEVDMLKYLVANERSIFEKLRMDLANARRRLFEKWTRIRQFHDELDKMVTDDFQSLIEELHAAIQGNEETIDENVFASLSLEQFQKHSMEFHTRPGLAVLRCLIYFSKKHRTKARLMISKPKYPFLPAADLVCRSCSDFLGISLQDFNNDLAASPWWLMLSEKDAIERVFCMTFLLLDINFAERRANLESLREMLSETKRQMSDLLFLGPRTVNQLWHSCIQLRAEDVEFKQEIAARQKSDNFTPGSPKSKEEDVASQQLTRRNSSVYSGVELDQILPCLRGGSQVLDEHLVARIESSLPSEFQGYDWVLYFASPQEGGIKDDLSAMYKAAEGIASILVVKDGQGHSFGAFLPEELSPSSDAAYYGSQQTLLFALGPEFQLFTWTGANNNFILANEDSIGIGGGGKGFAIYLDADLHTGTSTECETFRNSQLSHVEEFDVSAVELWGFQRRP